MTSKIRGDILAGFACRTRAAPVFSHKAVSLVFIELLFVDLLFTAVRDIKTKEMFFCGTERGQGGAALLRALCAVGFIFRKAVPRVFFVKSNKQIITVYLS